MRFPIVTAVLLSVVAEASGQQLGQTKETIVAQSGPAIEENHTKNTAVYRNGPWKVEIVYADNIAKKLTVTKIDVLTEDEIRSVLANNTDEQSGANRPSRGTRMWRRSDFATAQCDRINPRSISMTASPLRSPTTVAAPAPITDRAW